MPPIGKVRYPALKAAVEMGSGASNLEGVAVIACQAIMLVRWNSQSLLDLLERRIQIDRQPLFFVSEHRQCDTCRAAAFEYWMTTLAIR